MRFRPCIDLHQGKVKQIVGSTLSDDQPDGLKTNFVSQRPPSWFAELYRSDNLTGGHIIMLGPGNEQAATEALTAWDGGMQIGGGITGDNAELWLARGASQVIVTSWVFRDGQIDEERLHLLRQRVGKDRLVLDLSCRRQGDSYYIVTDRWQRFTSVTITQETLAELAGYCAEFLIHAADVEGKCAGVETKLIGELGRFSSIPITYAGGVTSLDDLELIRQTGQGTIDATIGSALDIFGGQALKYRDVVNYHQKYNQ